MNEVRLELLLGKQVYDVDGKAVGRVEEVKAEARGADLYVVEYHLGAYSFFERLSALAIGRAVLTAIGAEKSGSKKAVPWDKLDMRDLGHLRVTCRETTLQTLN
ncbi:PRC-barrel domain containing protein [Rhizobium sp. NLR9b]|uniref:PRC-barrel domain-containing protein n=1 Tax=unclassified Rhizobium TaxID=2613769 RepID=UPI001C8361DA|nr:MULTISPECIES: PRC-barrel domain-containing protein [unclassified Rhizobium]MBX5224432.1 PRC-barrel domain containing protein [Rhizobium sp. NLR8a]MBX5230039.1 PRC-barrel domain containing protein [Rhizobium sp. NLR9b]MBX5290706.1 PRC-barrel domain containing protein [Rhizobium sp. NLR10b]